MQITLAALALIILIICLAECVAMVLRYFFKKQISAFFDTTIGRLAEWLGLW